MAVRAQGKPPLAPPRTAGGAAAVAGRAAKRIADGALLELPLGVRFWDGSELASQDGAPSVVLRDPGAVAHLLRAPGQLGLARAWVDGSLDVADHDLEAVLRARAVRLRDAVAAAAPGLAALLRLDAGVSYAGGGSLLPCSRKAAAAMTVRSPTFSASTCHESG